MPDALPITARIVIPGEDLRYEFSRAGGPGGQHVNTTDTRVRVRLDLAGTAALREDVKERLRAAHPGKLTAEGELVVTCDARRSRHRNLGEARERLAAFVRTALTPPRPRRPTRPTRGSQRRRLAAKRQRADVKRGRQKVPGSGDD